ncbi:hypothetical protein DF200_09525 [Bifidobacterium catulorum]|uniref:Uncharacterized protein n=1 Tax=Bifidobacterium catulorum TaxID=1630173 RepID=A0A2U2MQE7_9BIFI|nr:hypothetical protein DF200_09525 [Bifidobacterium catulorum]
MQLPWSRVLSFQDFEMGFALFGLADSFLLDGRLWDDVVEVMPRCVRVIGFRVRHEDDFLSESLTITF